MGSAFYYYYYRKDRAMRIAFHLNCALEINGKNALTRYSWKRRKERVKKRDGAMCFYCGTLAQDGQPDHVIPLSRGGDDGLENLVWSCANCNASKGDRTLAEWRAAQEEDQIETGRVDQGQAAGSTGRGTVTPAQVDRVLALKAEGKSDTAIARELWHGTSHYIDQVREILSAEDSDNE